MIGVDWGSSSFRAYRIADDGAVTDRHVAACGALSLKPGDFPGVLSHEIGSWLAADDGPVLLCGMVGSRQGWREAGYVACPASAADLAGQLLPVQGPEGRTMFIVPGLQCRDPHGVPDVLRGEEMQLFGLAGMGQGEAMVCLPGTHSKHVRMEGGRVVGFTTAMTGEVFSLLRQQGALAALLDETATDFDDAAFAAGVDRSAQSGGLLHHLFGIRAMALAGELAAAAGADYLSGLLVGHELRQTAWQGQIVVAGAAQLAARYGKAFGRLGIQARIGPEDAAATGLYRLGRQVMEERS